MNRQLNLIFASICVIFCFGAIAQGKELKSNDGSLTSITWLDGRGQSATFWMDLTEVALIPERKVGPREIESIIVRWDNKARVVKKHPLFWRVKLGKALSKGDFIKKIRSFNRSHSKGQIFPYLYLTSQKSQARYIPTGELIVSYAQDVSRDWIQKVERETGLKSRWKILPATKTYSYKMDDFWKMIAHAQSLNQNPKVRYAHPNCLLPLQPYATPNDPLYSQQWHLNNTGQSGGTAGEDVANGQLETAWDNYRGSGIVIAILDDGLEISHEDLKDNILSGLSYDYFDGDTIPMGGKGNTLGGDHGTAVAGCAAARGFNGIGVSGVAPEAKMVGYRFLGGANTYANIANAFVRNLSTIHISNNSWGPINLSQRLAGLPTSWEDAFRLGVKKGRDGLGLIYVFSASNGYEEGNSNYNGWANSRYTIAVAGTDNQGRSIYYSSKGANVLISAPSAGRSGSLGILTTDRTGIDGYDIIQYTENFGGTSASAPQVSGCIALILEANPNLTWRDVQHILVESADKNNPSDSGWAINGAGKDINHRFGFGRINVREAINIATTWTNVGPEVNTAGYAAPQTPIPDNNSLGVESTIEIDANITIESVEIFFNANDHPYWTDLQVELISPDGTKSILAEQHNESPLTPSYDNWRFLSVLHWGENAQGTWKLVVKDLKGGDVGTFKSWGLKIYGTGSKGTRQAVNLKFDGSDGGGCSMVRIKREPDPLGFLLPLLVLVLLLVCLRRRGY